MMQRPGTQVHPAGEVAMFASIRTKFQAASVALVVLTVVSLSILAIRSLRTAHLRMKDSGEMAAETRFEDETRRHVEIMALAMDAALLAKHDDVTQTEREALALARAAHFDDRRGYFFVYDLAGNVLVNGGQPELEGKNKWDHRDPKGKLAIQELQHTAMTGGGFVEYHWLKPGGATEPVAKKAYVRMLQQRKWWIGTGVYLEDVNATMARDDEHSLGNVRVLSWRIGLVALALCVAALLAGGVVAGRIGRPLQEMVGAARRLAKGDVAFRVPVHGQDEVAELARAFEAMAHDIEAMAKKGREDERYRKRLLESLADGIVITNPKNDIEEINPAAERIFGYEPGELVGRPTIILVPEAQQAEYERNTLQSVLAGASVVHERVERRRKDGSTVRVRVTVSPVLGEDGEVAFRIHSVVPIA